MAAPNRASPSAISLFSIVNHYWNGTGDVMTFDTRGSYIRSEGPLVATLGVEDLIVVATNDAVLVARKDRDQDIRRIIERLGRR